MPQAPARMVRKELGLSFPSGSNRALPLLTEMSKVAESELLRTFINVQW